MRELGIEPWIEPQAGMFKGVSKEDFSKTLTDNFLPTNVVKLQQNALVINTGDKLVGLMYPIIVSFVCLVIGAVYISNKTDPDVSD